MTTTIGEHTPIQFDVGTQAADESLWESELISPNEIVEHMVADAQNGDDEAFISLLTRYNAVMRSRIRSQTRDTTVEDVLQATAEKAYKGIKTFAFPIEIINGEECKVPPAHAFGSWLGTIATHASIDHWRKEQRSGAVFSLDARDGAPEVTKSEMSYAEIEINKRRINLQGDETASQIIDSDTSSVEAALAQLSPKLRHVLQEICMNGLTNQEYAIKYDVKVMTVGTRLLRAKQALKDLILSGKVDLPIPASYSDV